MTMSAIVLFVGLAGCMLSVLLFHFGRSRRVAIRTLRDVEDEARWEADGGSAR